jgi:hypothetical protein
LNRILLQLPGSINIGSATIQIPNRVILDHLESPKPIYVNQNYRLRQYSFSSTLVSLVRVIPVPGHRRSYHEYHCVKIFSRDDSQCDYTSCEHFSLQHPVFSQQLLLAAFFHHHHHQYESGHQQDHAYHLFPPRCVHPGTWRGSYGSDSWL